MKIAVLSDIHGNMEALNAVLTDIKEFNCEKLFILGDYAMAGPEPASVVDRFMEMSNNEKVTMIQGNTDQMIANYSDDLYSNLKQNAPIMAEALKNDAEILSEKQKDFLKNLPTQAQLEVEGIKFLLVHGSPRQNNENILPDLSIETIEQMIEGTDADVILCGHTHTPCGYQTNKKQTVVNDGSVGRPFTKDPNACYLLMTVENGKCLFEHRFIKYNKELASQKLAKRSFAGADKLAQTLLDPKKRHF